MVQSPLQLVGSGEETMTDLKRAIATEEFKKKKVEGLLCARERLQG